MAIKNLVTQGEVGQAVVGLNALADNLDQHVNASLSKAHGWSILDSPYLDTGGDYQTDYGQTGFVAIPGLYNTGVNNDGTLAAPDSVDAHWTLILSPDPAHQGPAAFVANPLRPAWASDGPKSQWLSAQANASLSVKNGTYKFRITFNLSGLNPASAVIQGTWSVDDHATAMLLNGVTTGYTLPSGTLNKQPTSAFTLTSGFVPGLNTLDILVSANSNRVGIRMEVTGIASAGGVFKIPGIFNTGVKNDGTLDVQGNPDQHWKLLQSVDPSNPGPNAIIVKNLDPSWAKNTAVSQWIGTRSNAGQSVPKGTYVYRLTFDMTGFVPATAIIKTTFVSDDTLYQVLLNGQVTGANNGLNNTVKSSTKTAVTSFIISKGFQAGINNLDFYLYNGGGDSGLRIEVSATASQSGSGFAPRVLRLNIGGNIFYVPCQMSGGLDGTPDPAIPNFTGIVSPQSADPATDLTVGSPTPAQLVTTFAALVNAIGDAASNTLLQHAGSPAENVHGGLSWQPDLIINTAGYTVGTRTVNILINGVAYKIVGDINITGPA